MPKPKNQSSAMLIVFHFPLKTIGLMGVSSEKCEFTTLRKFSTLKSLISQFDAEKLGSVVQ
ncbi:hypothetical protein C6W22_03155 [Bacillus atrophaeus]|nr:hypothetical protein C6W22_03155 [Bacillus atrophaeus]